MTTKKARTRPTKPAAAPATLDAGVSPKVLQEVAFEKERVRLFADAYLECGGNQTQAALLAGFAPASAKQQASIFMKRLDVKAAIMKRQLAAATAMPPAELAKLYHLRATDPARSEESQDRNAKLLGVANGALTQKIQHEVRVVTWVDIVKSAEAKPDVAPDA